MKKFFFSIFLCCLFQFTSVVAQTSSITLMDSVVFYDGYAETVTAPIPKGISRLRNDLVTVPLKDPKQLSYYAQLQVTIRPHCDNYDRIGNVFLVLVPKGKLHTENDGAQRIELGRFITPFMDKNKDPKEVHYQFNISNYSFIFANKAILSQFDLWLDFGIFGVPYAAQNEIAGCTDRNDVYEGKISLTDPSQPLKNKHSTFHVLSCYQNINNYESMATDTLGKTTKSYAFEVKRTLKNAQLIVITSNHGANDNGEEYVRRNHYLYLNNNEVLHYVPGGQSCEPFRAINSQGNGIYGKTIETDSSWASWNNWCPGNVIPTRTVKLGKLKKGKHSIRISVPDAVFEEKQGYFPVSIVVIGK